MNHSIVEAKNNLSALVDRALAGEDVTITRHGRPVVRLVPAEQRRPLTGRELLALVDQLREGLPKIPDLDAGAEISRMRDEEWR